MIGFRIRSTFPEFQTWLGQLATKQVPFATAKALTKTALDARDEVKRELPRRFELRGGWVVGGIRIVPAEKRDWPRMSSQVGSRDAFMELQETGGTKRPKGAKNIAIPTKVQARRRSAGGRLPKGQKPRALRARKDVFVENHALKRRLPGKKRTGTKVLTLFQFRRTTHIRPRFGLQDTVEGTVQRVYSRRFREAFEEAIRTPKKPGKPR